MFSSLDWRGHFRRVGWVTLLATLCVLCLPALGLAASFPDTQPFSQLLCICNPPANLRIENATHTSVDLAWDDTCASESQVKVFRCDQMVAILDANTTTWTDTNTACGAAYTYVVKYYAGGGFSGPSNAVNMTMPACSGSPTPTRTTAPSCPAPTGLRVEGVTHNGVALAWNDTCSRETYVKVFRNGAIVGYLAPNTTRWTDTNLDCNTQYTYLVKYYTNGEWSAPSNTVQPTTLSCSATPTFTPHPNQKWIFGRVLDAGTGENIAGATVRLYRSTESGWYQEKQATTNGSGFFGWYVNPIASLYKLTEDNAPGYASVSAELAPGVVGEVVHADRMTFSLPDGASAGNFIFTDARHTPTPTATPSCTATATAVSPTATATAVSPTATATATPTDATHPPTVPAPTATRANVNIEGYAWRDGNGDGVRQDGEGLSGLEVTLSQRTTLTLQRERRATTDGRGYFRFADAAPLLYGLGFRDPSGQEDPFSAVADATSGLSKPLDICLEDVVIYLPLCQR